MEYLHRYSVRVLDPLAAKSPDLNPIKHIWARLTSIIRNGPYLSRNSQYLFIYLFLH